VESANGSDGSDLAWREVNMVSIFEGGDKLDVLKARPLSKCCRARLFVELLNRDVEYSRHHREK